MNKILKSHTIVPPHLYVERDADRQLLQIIDDMGRPGYILVARQMGKTNLLIHAKRKIEMTGDIFLYVDLSNRFDDARSCFRNIIDVLLSTNSMQLESVAESIYNSREEKKLPAHKEHTLELIKIIKAISGKLIICLDEIDSLTLADYSDKIFAQIRSVYFERINFPEFERLSYVLSGVAEPSEIIKDRSISPFNIGQKIFLNDFSINEFNAFLNKAKLQLSKESSDRVYFWTNGNPRLTWELCSEIESQQIKEENINVSMVDHIVKYKYLSSFDTPPVDHIRSLITSDKNLRDGLKLIYDKSESKLTDEVKGKLYLAGILSPRYESGIIEIKNKIIAESINERWLATIPDEKMYSMSHALELSSEGEHKEAAKILEILLQKKDINKDDKRSLSIQLGTSYFHIGKFQESKNLHKENLFDKSSYKAIYLDQIYMIGVSSSNLGQYDDAVNYFEEIIDEKSSYYVESLINLAATYISCNFENKKDEIPKLIAKALELCAELDAKDKDINLIPTAYSLLANFSQLNGDLVKANQLYLKTSELAEDTCKVNPLISAYNIIEDPSLLDRIKNVMEKSDFSIAFSIFNSNLIFDTRDFINLASLAANKSDSLLDFLFSFALTHEGDDHFNLTNLLLESAMAELAKPNIQSSLKILNKLYSLDSSEIRSTDNFTVLKYLLFFAEGVNTESIKNEYFKGFQNYVVKPDVIDINLFEKELAYLIAKQKFNKAIAISNLLLQLTPEPTFKEKIELIRIYFYRIHCLNEPQEVIDDGGKFLEMIKLVNKDDLSTIHIKYDEIRQLSEKIEEYVNGLSSASKKIETYRRKTKKLGRNDQVKVKYINTEEVVTDKFKKLEKDISTGMCQII